MNDSATDPLQRLNRAVDLFLEHRDRCGPGSEAGGDEAEFLELHAELADLLEPLLHAEPGVTDLESDASERYLGDYRLLRELGRGGMGVVYEAVEESLGRRVALKILPAHLTLSPRQVERFRREASAAARLRHPGIVGVHAVGTARGAHFFAMEFVDGRTLRDALHDNERNGEGRLGVVDGVSYAAEAAELVAQIAEALDYAHGEGVIHRDVKPHNIMLADGRARLVDFGLARDLDQDTLSRTGDFAGTPHYVSPEQALGRPGSVDRRSDVFSIGVVLYEILGRRRPFDGDTTQQVLSAVVAKQPAALRRSDARVPRDLEIICRKALEKDPDHRYPSAAAMAADLRRFLRHEPIEARPPGPVTRLCKLARRHRARAVAVTLALVVVTGAIAVSIGNARQNRLNDQHFDRARQAFEGVVKLLDGTRALHQPGREDFYRRQIESVIAQFEELCAQTDSDPAVRYQTAGAHGRAARFYLDVRALDQAARSATRAVDLMRSLVVDQPDDVRYRYCLAGALQARSLTADDATRQGADLAEAEMHFVRGSAGSGDYAERSIAGLAHLHTVVVNSLLEAPDRSQAPEMERRLTAALALWARAPEHRREQEPSTLVALGRLRTQQKRYDEAVAAYQEARARAGERLRETPGDRDHRSTIATAHHGVGMILKDGRGTDHLRAAHAGYRELVRAFPRSFGYREQCVNVATTLAHRLRGGDQNDAGSDDLLSDAAVDVAELRRHEPENINYLRLASQVAHCRLLELHADPSRDAAIWEAELRQIVTLCAAIEASGEASAVESSRFGAFLCDLASAELQRDALVDADEHVHAAMEKQRAALARQPDNAKFARLLRMHENVRRRVAERHSTVDRNR